MTHIQNLCNGQENLWSNCTRESIWNILLICYLQKEQGTDASQLNLQNCSRFKTGSFWQQKFQKRHLYCLKHSKAPIFNVCSQCLHSPAGWVIWDESAEHENPNNMSLSTCCSELQQQTHSTLLGDIPPNTFPPGAQPTPQDSSMPGCLLSLPTQLCWVPQTHTQNLSCTSQGLGRQRQPMLNTAQIQRHLTLKVSFHQHFSTTH